MTDRQHLGFMILQQQAKLVGMRYGTDSKEYKAAFDDCVRYIEKNRSDKGKLPPMPTLETQKPVTKKARKVGLLTRIERWLRK